MSNVQSKFFDSATCFDDNEPYDVDQFSREAKIDDTYLLTSPTSELTESYKRLSNNVLTSFSILRKIKVSETIVKNIETSQELLSRLLRSEKQTKVASMIDLLRGGCINICSVDSCSSLKKRLQFAMRFVSAAVTKKFPDLKCNNWNADGAVFGFRTNFVHHRLSNKDVDAIKILSKDKFFLFR